jgi:sucrose-6-phosphate hydrolase SacC (GH32 family)
VPATKKQPLGEETFLNNSGGHPNFYTKDIYAPQAWKQSYEGDGPFYQLAFMMVKGAPTHNRTWSQQMIFPVELTLRTINNEIRLCRNPIDGIKQLRYDPTFWKNLSLRPNDNPLEKIDGDVFELDATITPGKAKEISVDIRGEKAVYNTAAKQLIFMGDTSRLLPQKDKIRLRFIIDRNSVEIYANEGEVNFTRLFYPEQSNMNLSLTTAGGECIIDKMELYRLESIWLKREQELGYKR